jgi:hypothetical protein
MALVTVACKPTDINCLITLWICLLIFFFFSYFYGCILICFLLDISAYASLLSLSDVCVYLSAFFSLSERCVDLSTFVFFVRYLCGSVYICFLCQIFVWICLHLFSLSDICVDLSTFVFFVRYLCGSVYICFLCQIFV